MAEIMWKCKSCGHLHVGIDPPEECPGCGETSDSFKREREIAKRNTKESVLGES